MTREEALEVLRFEWYQHEDGSLVEQAIEKAFEALTWISVEERLPKKTGKYLVCTAKKAVYCAKFYTYFSDRYPHGYFGTDQYTHITHWMPLPEPPKEDANA